MDDDALRRTFSRFGGGVYVLCARDGERLGAATIAWAMQVSFRPPLVAVALGRGSNVFGCLERSRFAVLHVVGQRQLGLARSFACPTEAAEHRINGEPWVEGVTKSPVLPVFPAHVECAVEAIHAMPGEHSLVVLQALRARCHARFRPLAIEALRDYLKLEPLPARRALSRPAANGRSAPALRPR